MEKIIWVITNNREDMIMAQRSINSTGSMRAVCLLSFGAVQKAVTDHEASSRFATPSLILMDYETSVSEDFAILTFLKRQQGIASVPLFFMAQERSTVIDEECYEKGAMVILGKPLSHTGILRMERTAWQHEVTRNYEKMVQKQISELQSAKEIYQLNQKLQARNELLYQVFGRYFSDQVVEVILEGSDGGTIGGEKREVTVLMTDLRGFTSLAENLNSDAVTDLLNFYFGKMSKIINTYQGTVIEFLGDAVLAVFGAPVPSKRQSEQAVAAAIQMQNAMEETNAYCDKKGYPQLEMGIGIHRGEAFVGNVGSEDMMRYNVIGRVVNECSRIQGYSVGGQILASRETIEEITGQVVVQNWMEVNAKGIHKPVAVCEIIGLQGEYACSLSGNHTDNLLPCKKDIRFYLYLLEGKQISDYLVIGALRQISRKCAVVELEQTSREIDIFSDLEIVAQENGKRIFSGVYAKVIREEEDRLFLRFTHVNEAFEDMIKELTKGAM